MAVTLVSTVVAISVLKGVSCCSVCLGIDVGRFIADEQYKLETILGLAM